MNFIRLQYVLSVFLLGTALSIAQKNMRIGYVDMDFVLANVEEYKIANEQFDIQVEQWRTEIEKKSKQITDEKEKLEAEKPLLTPELIKDKEEEIALLEYNLRAYQEKKFGATEGEYIKQKFMLTKPIQDQVFNAAQEIGKLRKYDFIFEKNDVSMLFSNKQHNLSHLILRILNKKNNADDRNKDISELLKENYDFEVVDERVQRRAQLEQERQKRIEEQEKLREERRQMILKEREEKAKAREEARLKLLEERAANKKNNN
ncbi:MAG: OmpH family outer membrane protein [Capnocytophaga sp.]|nr:OmpH family outer membrane protein [Capnocytophaga sp.]